MFPAGIPALLQRSGSRRGRSRAAVAHVSPPRVPSTFSGKRTASSDSSGIRLPFNLSKPKAAHAEHAEDRYALVGPLVLVAGSPPCYAANFASRRRQTSRRTGWLPHLQHRRALGNSPGALAAFEESSTHDATFAYLPGRSFALHMLLSVRQSTLLFTQSTKNTYVDVQAVCRGMLS